MNGVKEYIKEQYGSEDSLKRKRIESIIPLSISIDHLDTKNRSVDETISKFPRLTGDDLLYEVVGNLIYPFTEITDVDIKNEIEMYDKLFMPPEIKEGIIECPQCKSNKIISTFVQLRSADEGTTALFTCTNCNKTWKQD